MKTIRSLLLWLLALTILIPLALVVLNSFKTQMESVSMNLRLPGKFQFDNYATVIREGHMMRAFLNSLIIAAGTVLLANVSAAMGAYVLARRKSRLNRWIYYLFIVGLIAPINYVTTIKVMQTFHVINTFPGIILLYSALMIPFTVFLFYGFVSSVPLELDEAAIIDGCTGWRLFARIQVPLMMPVAATAVLINFMNAWNEFVLPLYVFNRSTANPMTLAVYNFYGTYMSSWNLVCAAIVLTTLPIVIVYLFGQRYIVSGVIAGAIKG